MVEKLALLGTGSNLVPFSWDNLAKLYCRTPVTGFSAVETEWGSFFGAVILTCCIWVVQPPMPISLPILLGNSRAASLPGDGRLLSRHLSEICYLGCAGLSLGRGQAPGQHFAGRTFEAL